MRKVRKEMFSFLRIDLSWRAAIVVAWFAFAGFGQVATGQTPVSPTGEIATAVRVFDPEDGWVGDLYITVDGSERMIAERAGKAWIISEGKEVIYSSDGGPGGFEGEGHTMHIYNVKIRETREVLSHYYMIDEVKEAKLASGATALLIDMSDGSAGNPYFAVVDPKRGEVFFTRFAKLSRVNGDTITLNFYRVGDWDKEYPPKDEPDPRPKNTKTISLTKVLKKKVICNKPDHRSDRSSPC